MRLASFAVPDSGKKTYADTSIVMLKGTGGGLVANVNRWRNQVGLEPASKNAILKHIKTGKSKLGNFQWIKIKNAKKPQKAIFVSVLPVENVTIFVKMTGSINALEMNKKKFLALCKSLRASPEK